MAVSQRFDFYSRLAGTIIALQTGLIKYKEGVDSESLVIAEEAYHYFKVAQVNLQASAQIVVNVKELISYFNRPGKEAIEKTLMKLHNILQEITDAGAYTIIDMKGLKQKVDFLSLDQKEILENIYDTLKDIWVEIHHIS
jgi:hypothetical protein